MINYIYAHIILIDYSYRPMTSFTRLLHLPGCATVISQKWWTLSGVKSSLTRMYPFLFTGNDTPSPKVTFHTWCSLMQVESGNINAHLRYDQAIIHKYSTPTHPTHTHTHTHTNFNHYKVNCPTLEVRRERFLFEIKNYLRVWEQKKYVRSTVTNYWSSVLASSKLSLMNVNGWLER